MTEQRRVRAGTAGHLRVAVVTTSFPLTSISASGPFILELVRHLPDHVQVEVITPCAPKPVQQLVSGRFRVNCFRYAPKRWQTLAHGPGGIPAAIGRGGEAWLLMGLFVPALFLACLRAARQADLIHANWSISGVIAGVAGWLTGVPVITTLRGTDVSRSDSGGLFRALLGTCFRLNARVVTVGRGIQERAALILGVDPRRIRVIANGVDKLFFACPVTDATGPLRLVTVGSLVPVKGMDTLFAALALMPSEIDWMLTVVGEGPERLALESMGRRNGIDGRISFSGVVPPEQIPDVLARHHVLVLASRSEGRPNALIEALAAARAVVASRIPEIAELVDEGKNGLLFSPDDAHGLAAQLQCLDRDRELLRQMGARGRASVRGLDWANTGQSYAKLYEETVSGRAKKTVR